MLGILPDNSIEIRHQPCSSNLTPNRLNGISSWTCFITVASLVGVYNGFQHSSPWPHLGYCSMGWPETRSSMARGCGKEIISPRCLLFSPLTRSITSSPSPQHKESCTRLVVESLLPVPPFYVDDVTIFVLPINNDIKFLASTMQSFGEVIYSITICQNSSAVPIWCGGVDLDDILQIFPTCRVTFLKKYLALSLSVTRIKSGPL